MVKTTIVPMTPNETSTDGFLRLRETGQPAVLKFQPDPDFRGTLISVEWNLPDGVIHRIEPIDDEFAQFNQVGQRPEIEVSTEWIESLGLPVNAFIRIRFEFHTFRREPVWYAYLYFRSAYGDEAKDSDAPYLIKDVD